MRVYLRTSILLPIDSEKHALLPSSSFRLSSSFHPSAPLRLVAACSPDHVSGRATHDPSDIPCRRSTGSRCTTQRATATCLIYEEEKYLNGHAQVR